MGFSWFGLNINSWYQNSSVQEIRWGTQNQKHLFKTIPLFFFWLIKFRLERDIHLYKKVKLKKGIRNLDNKIIIKKRDARKREKRRKPQRRHRNQHKNCEFVITEKNKTIHIYSKCVCIHRSSPADLLPQNTPKLFRNSNLMHLFSFTSIYWISIFIVFTWSALIDNAN